MFQHAFYSTNLDKTTLTVSHTDFKTHFVLKSLVLSTTCTKKHTNMTQKQLTDI